MSKTLVGTVAVAALLLSGCMNIAGTVYHEDRSYEVDGAQLKGLQMRLGAGGAEIVGTDAKTISVHEHLSYTKSHKPKTHHDRAGDSLAIGYDCPDGIDFGSNTCGVDYRIQLPRALALRLQDGSGDVTLHGLSGGVQVRVGSGDVQADDLRGGQTVVQTGSGSVRIHGGTGRLDLRSASGDITATGVRADDLRAHADSGGVQLDLVNAPSSVYADSASGSVNVTVPEGLSYAVDAATDSGRRRVNVRVDGASPHRIKAHTGSGDVTVAG